MLLNCGSTNIPVRYFTGRCWRSHRPADPNFLCCLPTTRPAISPRWYSASRSRLRWTTAPLPPNCVLDSRRSCGRRGCHAYQPDDLPWHARFQGPSRIWVRRERVDWHCFRCRSDVYRPVHGVSRRSDGTAAHLAHSRRPLHRAAYLPALRAQLQPGDCNGIPRRPDLRHVLSTHAHVRASEHSSSIPSFYTCLVRNLRGRGGEHRAFALWLVQKPSFVELDVLEFGAHHAADDDLHLLRDTWNQCTEEIRERTELRRIFVRERGPCCVAGRL